MSKANNFADRLSDSCLRHKSFIVAGFDPQIQSLPKFFLDEIASRYSSNEDLIYHCLRDFHDLALQALSGKVAAIKPNIAFFEQYGLAGLRAFHDICLLAKERNLPVIADVKRGDIGTTAKAYSSAYLGRSSVFGKTQAFFDVDAITVSPYLGFDTIETFFEDCREYGKGIFVLVRTSNPGSADLQSLKTQAGETVSEAVAQWLAKQGEGFVGSSGLSSLGAVIGATYPDEARAMRRLMPKNLFLIPGLGAQGGSASDAVAGFSSAKNGGIINVSRGLLAGFNQEVNNLDSLKAEIAKRADKFNSEIAASLR